jgi:hypothetical protein
MGSEQGFKALAQLGIAVAGAVEKGGALGLAQLNSGLKQGFLALRCRLHVRIMAFIYQIKRNRETKSMWKNFDILFPRLLRL